MSVPRQGRRKNVYLCIIAFCLLIWLLTVTKLTSAEPSPDPTSVDTLRQMQEQVNQQRSNLSNERDRLSDIEQAVQGQIGGIQVQIESTDTTYKDYESQIQLAYQRINKLQVYLS